ncbi:MAG: hypothetical protein KDD44_03005, partial [Bdellovibrionales bacterium]|nr:hypothetical protein [Bdellovibrionales bacterium]
LAGFPAGCAYVFDPSSNALVPRLVVGVAEPDEYPVVHCSPLDSGDQLLPRAFRGTAPVVRQNAWGQSSTVVIADAFGHIQRAGVLMLEAAPDLVQRGNAEMVSVYKALHQALIDCLKLT